MTQCLVASTLVVDSEVLPYLGSTERPGRHSKFATTLGLLREGTLGLSVLSRHRFQDFGALAKSRCLWPATSVENRVSPSRPTVQRTTSKELQGQAPARDPSRRWRPWGASRRWRRSAAARWACQAPPRALVLGRVGRTEAPPSPRASSEPVRERRRAEPAGARGSAAPQRPGPREQYAGAERPGDPHPSQDPAPVRRGPERGLRSRSAASPASLARVPGLRAWTAPARPVSIEPSRSPPLCARRAAAAPSPRAPGPRPLWSWLLSGASPCPGPPCPFPTRPWDSLAGSLLCWS